jgi:hypothetical protein
MVAMGIIGPTLAAPPSITPTTALVLSIPTAPGDHLSHVTRWLLTTAIAMVQV